MAAGPSGSSVAPAPPVGVAAVADDVADGDAAGHRPALGEQCDPPGELPGREAGGRDAVGEVHHSGLDRVQPGQGPQQCGLAAAVGPDQCGDGARAQVDHGSVHHRHTVIAQMEVDAGQAALPVDRRQLVLHEVRLT